MLNHVISYNRQQQPLQKLSSKLHRLLPNLLVKGYPNSIMCTGFLTISWNISFLIRFRNLCIYKDFTWIQWKVLIQFLVDQRRYFSHKSIELFHCFFRKLWLLVLFISLRLFFIFRCLDSLFVCRLFFGLLLCINLLGHNFLINLKSNRLFVSVHYYCLNLNFCSLIIRIKSKLLSTSLSANCDTAYDNQITSIGKRVTNSPLSSVVYAFII